MKRSTNPVDWFGLGLLTAGVASLQYVLERGQTEDWFGSQTIVVDDGRRGRSRSSRSSLRELRRPAAAGRSCASSNRASFTAGNIIGVVSGFGLFGSSLMMPLYFQNVMGFTAMDTGLALLPGAIATAISMPIASRAVKYVDQRVCIAFGLALFALGCWLVGGLNGEPAFADTLLPRAIQGFALGFMWVPLTTATLSDDLPRQDGRRDRRLHAGAPARRQPRHRDPAAGRNAPSGFRLRRARVGRHDGQPSRREHAARGGEPIRRTDQHLQHRDAQRRDDRLQRRLPAVRGGIPHLDSVGLCCYIRAARAAPAQHP